MPEIDNPHDAFFKAAFGRREVAADLLANYLPPEVAAALDLRTLEPIKDSFVDPELREHFSDLLYRVGLRGGGLAYACLLFEHKSAPEAMIAFQLLRYKVQTWEQLIAEGAKKLPPIIPIVIYHGRRRWRVARNFGALIEWTKAESLRKYVDEFEYHLLDFSVFSKTKIVGKAFAQAALLTLKHAFTGELIERLPEIVRLLPTRERRAIEYLATILHYVAEVSRPLTRNEFDALKKEIPKERGELMETWASALTKEGMQKGLQLGREEGREEGRQEAGIALTMRQLQRQIGSVDERKLARLRKLSFEQLVELGEALLDFNSPRDLAAWLRAHASKAS